LPVAACMTALLLCYSVFIAHYYAPAICHVDSNGYWAQGTLIATTGQASFRTESPVQYVGKHWLRTPSGLYISRYPPGLPMIVAAVTYAFGPEASVLINPVLAVLALLGTFLVGARIAGPWWGLLAAVALAFNPTFNAHTLSSISHMAIAALMVWAVYLLVRWADGGGPIGAFGAGILLGCIPTVRYPESLFLVGAAAFLILQRGTRPRMWLHYAAAAAGALLPIVALLAWNHMLMGAFWRTAYSLSGEQTGFGIASFTQHWLNYVEVILREGMNVLLPISLLGVALMISLPAGKPGAGGRTRILRPFGLLVALAVVPLMLLYMAYYWGGGVGGPERTVRFMVPLFPLLSVCAMWALCEVTAPMGRAPRLAAVGTLMVLYLLWGGTHTIRECRSLAYHTRTLAKVTEELRAHVPPQSIVVADTQILQHLDFIRAWRLVDTERPSRAAIAGLSGSPDGAKPARKAGADPALSRYEGLSGPALEKAIAEDIRAWAHGADVYFVCGEADLAKMAGPCFTPASLKVVARIDLRGARRGLGRGEPSGVPTQGGEPQNGDNVGRAQPARTADDSLGMAGAIGSGISRQEQAAVIALWKPGNCNDDPDVASPAAPDPPAPQM
jgi:hypothetical protein